MDKGKERSDEPVIDKVLKTKNALLTLFDVESDVSISEIKEKLNELKKIKALLTKKVIQDTKIGGALSKVSNHSGDEHRITEDIRNDCRLIINFLKKKLTSSPSKSLKKLDAEYIGPIITDQKRKDMVLKLMKAYDTAEKSNFRNDIRIEVLSELCHNIEESLFNSYGFKTSEYIDQFRSIYTNLADPKNPDFRRDLYDRNIDVQTIATMGARDMASKKKKEAVQEELKNSREACQSDWDIRHVKRGDGQFKCMKCKSMKTDYFQAQTRSADEPMTTYVNCNNCGNRWKF